MVHRFQSFEIDEATRELRAGARVVPLQPRVFDLLVYLVRHRERVVPKEELLDAVWPGVLVTDGSLQRAVSLARSALAEVNAAEAIRTSARRGYRFCSASLPENAAGKLSPLEQARAAYSCHDWNTVIAAMEQVTNPDELTDDDLQHWVHAVQGNGRSETAAQPLERAVAAFRSKGNRRRAAWVSILLAQMRLEWRDAVLAQGWHHRAERLLEGEPPGREHGYLAFLGCRLAFMANEIEAALELAEKTRQIGERFHDADLEGVGLVSVGEASLYLGRIRQGLAAIDEAGVSVVANDLSPWAGGLVYCSVIYSCMTRADWHRAGQWTEQFTRWGESRGALAYPGLCRIHRAEVLALRGELDEAERELRATRDMLARQAPWAEGEACRVLGEILLAKGESAAAREALEEAARLGWGTQFELALLHLEEGDAPSAARLLAQAIAANEWSCRSRLGRALAHHVIAASSAGNLKEARAALAELARDPDLTATSALQALTTQARGELAAAENKITEATQLLRSALRAWLAIEAPLAAAQTRLRLVPLLMNGNDPKSARLELTAAASVFGQAGAKGFVRHCDRLRKELGSAGKRPAIRRVASR